VRRRLRRPSRRSTAPRRVLVAAVVQGAIFAGVKAAVDRAGAKGFKKITGKDLET
jgi:hypothetical protein